MVSMIPLFNEYPALRESINYRQLANLFTPLKKIEALETRPDCNEILIKRDDISGSLYGGNKIRKLEFVFGDALAAGATRVITSGAAGSNHALAVALYGKKLGLKVTLMLFEQPFNPDIYKNLLADYSCDAQMYLDQDYESHVNSMDKMIRLYREIDNKEPFVIPAGGSSVSGVLGYVNAAFELKEQVAKGELREPAAIYVALGTMGTAVGLLLGLKAAKIKSKLIAVQVVPSYVANYQKFAALFEDTNRHLHRMDNSFPLFRISPDDLVIETNYLGEGYGFATEKSAAAVEFMKKQHSLSLDTVYTGKTFAALMDAVKERKHDGDILFWNTKNSVPLPGYNIDYKQLPESFHHFFQL